MAEHEFKYATNRQAHINNVKPADLDDTFRVIIEWFGKEWLETPNGNVIQVLWDRPDHLATIELFHLGFALRELAKTDSPFVKAKVKEIKGADKKTQNGAFFELFALNAFMLNRKVVAAKEGNPGFDGTITLVNDKSLKLFIKNYSISAHHLDFLKNAQIAEEYAKELMAKHKCPPVETIINKKSGYPTSDDWKELMNQMEGLYANMPDFKGNLATGNIGDWGITQRQIPPTEGTFSQLEPSYTFILSAPFHKNEEKNLHDKLEEACVNLTTHSATETANEKNAMMIHLPRIASRKNCEQWTKSYLAAYPDKAISVIFLYQPLVIATKDGKGTYISNGLSIVAREGFYEDLKGSTIEIAFPVGKIEHPYGEHAIFI
ncbi:MAG TPA: hypothetical protein VK625_01090, partial [Flavitalea sp.]|nr:hypothetical protein [Flavitalea sp.]